MFEDYNDYIFIYLLAIKDINDDKFDILTHHFNNYLFLDKWINEAYSSHNNLCLSFSFDYALALGALQKRNLPSFIEQLLEVTYQQEVEKDGFERLGTIDEIQIINDSIEYTTIYKEVYNSLFNVAADCLQEYFN